jgi:hypothetical protein
MSPEDRPRAFRRDNRGNRLVASRVADHASGHHLWLRGTDEMADQIKRAAPEYRNAPVPRPEEWTHALYSPGRPRDELAPLLRLLAEVITLPTMPNIAGAIALDWYKDPSDDTGSYEWPNSEVGQLVNLGKYRFGSHPNLRARYGHELAGHLYRAVERHPGFRGVDVVVNVPGHDSVQISFGGQLTATVAKNIQKPFVKLQAKDRYRHSAKSVPPEQRAEVIRGQFFATQSLVGMTVLVVDDVLHTGESMRDAARAALEAGASLVYGVCAARTMRS